MANTNFVVDTGLSVGTQEVINSSGQVDFERISNYTETVQDLVGGMVTGNTESGIAVTYQDVDGTIDFDVNDPTISLTGDVSGSATMTNLGNVSITTTVGANSVALGTNTTGNYVGTGATSGNGLSGSNSGEGGAFTVTSNATNDNTASTIVFRDASGNFSAGTITGALAGNASTATTLAAGADRTKLDGIEAGATGDQTNAEIRAAVAAATDSNVLSDALLNKVNAIEASADVTDAANVNAAGAVMNSDTTTLGMSFVIDEDNMISNSATKVPTQQSVKTYVDNEVSDVIAAAPGALDTLNELAAAIDDDANFATTVTNSIATKLPLAGGTMTGNIVMSGAQTVDGRDLSVDGAKLDGIESGATADQTAEEIQDIVGGMLTGNTENGIAVTYQDADGTIDFDVNDPTISLTGDVTGSATMTNLGNVSIAATVAANSVALGTDTTGNYTTSVAGGTGVSVAGGTGEGNTPTVSIGQAVATTSDVQFGSVNVDGNTVIDTNETAVSTSAVNVWTGSSTTYRSAKFVIQAQKGTDFEAKECLVLHNGTTAYYTEYAVLHNNGSFLTITADVSAGTLRLRAASTATGTTVNVTAIATKV